MKLLYQGDTYHFAGIECDLWDDNPNRVYNLRLLGTPIVIEADATISTSQVAEVRDVLCEHRDAVATAFDFGVIIGAIVGHCKIKRTNNKGYYYD